MYIAMKPGNARRRGADDGTFSKLSKARCDIDISSVLLNFQAALERNDMETILAIVEANKRVKLVNYIGNTALHIAAALATPEIVHMIVREGANVNARNENEETPLHHTIWGDGSTRKAVISILLRAGADINAANNQLATALHGAVGLSNSLCVKALLQAGADPAIADVMGETPREMALTRHLSSISSIFLEPRIVRPRALALGQLSSRSQDPPSEPSEECKAVCKYFAGFFWYYNSTSMLQVPQVPIWSMLYDQDNEKAFQNLGGQYNRWFHLTDTNVSLSGCRN